MYRDNGEMAPVGDAGGLVISGGVLVRVRFRIRPSQYRLRSKIYRSHFFVPTAMWVSARSSLADGLDRLRELKPPHADQSFGVLYWILLSVAHFR